MMITKEQLAAAAAEAINNWDHDLMEPGQIDTLNAVVNHPHNFADNDGNVEIPDGWDIWKYLEEVSLA